jgi:hypothetical protein
MEGGEYNRANDQKNLVCALGVNYRSSVFLYRLRYHENINIIRSSVFLYRSIEI